MADVPVEGKYRVNHVLDPFAGDPWVEATAKALSLIAHTFLNLLCRPSPTVPRNSGALWAWGCLRS
jgi:hypothetical protein